MSELSFAEWTILDTLVDDIEPFEVVDRFLSGFVQNLTPLDTIKALFKLAGLGYIRIFQMPIKPLGQDFKENEIIPRKPEDIMGDLTEYFEQYCVKRDYLRFSDIGGSRGGIPFGIWFRLSDSGRAEWSSERYREYSFGFN